MESLGDTTVSCRRGAAERLVDRVLQCARAQLGSRRREGLLVDVDQTLSHVAEYITIARRISFGRRRVAALPDAAVEAAAVKVLDWSRIAVIVSALWFTSGSIVEAQPPIRIGATLAQTGVYAVPAQNQLRGYQLCVKHVNDKGGVLGRKLELVVYDDGSDPATAVSLYERLITQDKVDLVLGPYSSPISEAVADVSEKYRTPMVAPIAAATSIYRKGRKFIFSMLPSVEVFHEGLIDIAVRKDLRSVAVISADDLSQKAGAQGTIELAKKKGLQVVFVDVYPLESTDFSEILTKIRAANPDVLAAFTRFQDTVAIIRQMKSVSVNPRMVGLTVGVDTLKFYEALGRDAEFVYGATAWVPELVELRAGGLIPIARQYPGAREFVQSYKKEFPGADSSYHSAAGYGGCEILVDAIRRAGSRDGDKLREAVLRIDRNTVFGRFKVDPDGVQIGHKMLTVQWQDGKKVIVWPEELAQGKPRFPTPPWNQR
jgi:branched-chain amino acid transport system substrate-binding protein